jgi:hypothetical protein
MLCLGWELESGLLRDLILNLSLISSDHPGFKLLSSLRMNLILGIELDPGRVLRRHLTCLWLWNVVTPPYLSSRMLGIVLFN